MFYGYRTPVMWARVGKKLLSFSLVILLVLLGLLAFAKHDHHCSHAASPDASCASCAWLAIATGEPLVASPVVQATEICCEIVRAVVTAVPSSFVNEYPARAPPVA